MKRYLALRAVAGLFTVIGGVAFILTFVYIVISSIDALSFASRYRIAPQFGPMIFTALPFIVSAIFTLAFGQLIDLIVNAAQDLQEIKVNMSRQGRAMYSQVEGIHRNVGFLATNRQGNVSNPPENG